jgi:S-ribosylhomocysteine lyase
MGCLTGFYLLLAGDLKSQDIVPLMLELFQHISGFKGEIPGASAVECGNYRLMDLAGAQQEARTFANEILTGISDAQLFYPE